MVIFNFKNQENCMILKGQHRNNTGRNIREAKSDPIQQVLASELHSITKPWPFRGWTLDLIGQIHPPSSKGHRYILVALDYITKWVETIPLKNID